jgi:hypothetical protein
MSLLQPVPPIVKAIEETRLIRLTNQGKERIVEPHDHGILNGEVPVAGIPDRWLQQSPDPRLAPDENR